MAAAAVAGDGGGLDLERLRADLLARRADVKNITPDKIARILLPIFRQMDSLAEQAYGRRRAPAKGAMDDAAAARLEFNSKDHEAVQIIDALYNYPVGYLRALRLADASLDDGSTAFQMVKVALDMVACTSILFDIESSDRDLETAKEVILSKIRVAPDSFKERALSGLMQRALDLKREAIFILFMDELPEGTLKNQFTEMHRLNQAHKVA